MIDTLNGWVVLICIRNQIENQRNLKCNMHNNCVYFNNEGKINGENVRNDDSTVAAQVVIGHVIIQTLCYKARTVTYGTVPPEAKCEAYHVI